MNIQQILNDKITQAMISAGADSDVQALVRQSGKPQFGDYQANGIMGAAKNWAKILVSSPKASSMCLILAISPQK